jgi:hypothetical protein
MAARLGLVHGVGAVSWAWHGDRVERGRVRAVARDKQCLGRVAWPGKLARVNLAQVWVGRPGKGYRIGGR